MRTIFMALALFTAGCSTPMKKVPVPAAARDGKTPVTLGKPNLSQRIIEQRILDGQVARGKLAVDGQLVR